MFMLFDRLNATLPANTSRLHRSPQFHEGKFQNQKQHQRKGKSSAYQYFKRLFTERNPLAVPQQPIDTQPINKVDLLLLNAHQIHLYRLGHSSILLKLGSDFWLIDPVFSQRASPFSFLGPKRFHQAPISIEQLPDLKGVIISHNHYDHLDKNSIEALSKKTEVFLAPLGVDGDLIKWGVRPSQITTFDWWEQQRVNNVELTFTPAHHYSGRGFKDNSSTLWGSWVIEFNQQKIFFSGDSGYFAGFEEIGSKHGPFDLCLIESGAYDLQWSAVHMQPEQSLQACLDLRGKALLPIHNATFNLAFHTWYEPLARISQLADEHKLILLTPKFGQLVSVGEALNAKPWWPSN